MELRVYAKLKAIGSAQLETQMATIAQSVYLDSQPGLVCKLKGPGTALENPYVYDDAAKELKAMAASGLVEIMSERSMQYAGDQLIGEITFKRLN